MTKEEAKKVIEILSHADNGCSHCIRQLEEMFVREFPQFTKLIIDRED